MAIRKQFIFHVTGKSTPPIPPLGVTYYASFDNDQTLYAIDNKGIKTKWSESNIILPQTVFSGTLIDEDKLILSSVPVENNSIISSKITNATAVALSSSVADIALGDGFAYSHISTGGIFKTISDTIIDITNNIVSSLKLYSETETINQTSNYTLEIKAEANDTTKAIDYTAQIVRTLTNISGADSRQYTDIDLTLKYGNIDLSTSFTPGDIIRIVDSYAGTFDAEVDSVNITVAQDQIIHIAFDAVPDAGTWQISLAHQGSAAILCNQVIKNKEHLNPQALTFDADAGAIQTYLQTTYENLYTVTGNYTDGFDVTCVGNSFNYTIDRNFKICKNGLTSSSSPVTTTSTEIQPYLGNDTLVVLTQEIGQDLTNILAVYNLTTEPLPIFEGEIGVKIQVENLVMPFTLS